MKLSLLSLLPLLVVVKDTNAATSSSSRSLRGRKGKRPVIRWASSGGGWRAMVADMGFANAFSQAGLLGGRGLLTRGGHQSDFSAISTTSGGSWFSTQFFYSPEFHKRTLGRPKELSNFIMAWMEAYLQLQETAPPNAFCDEESGMLNLISRELGLTVNATDLCDIFMQYEGDWGSFVSSMLNATSTAYDDPSFVSQSAGPSNRVPSLSNTDLYIQMTLAPNAKCGDTIAYLTPASDNNVVYTVPLAAQHAVKSDDTLFHVSVESDSLPLSVSVGSAAVNFSVVNFDAFYLTPGTSGQVTTDNSFGTSTSAFQTPFGGQPTVAQVASASSAVIGSFSGSAPSMLAQTYSVVLDYIAASNYSEGLKRVAEAALNQTVQDYLYANPAFQNIAVDTQWPSQCSSSDSRLLDGGYTDGLSLALNVGQYQSVDNGDLTKVLKLVVTDCNNVADDEENFLSYFSTIINAGVAPGGYIWPAVPGGLAKIDRMTPIRSAQIFQESLDSSSLASVTQTITGTNLTYAQISATTIDNPAFGIMAGQSAEILYLRVNSDIPTAVIGPDTTQEYMGPLANLAETIASSTELVSVVESFLSN